MYHPSLYLYLALQRRSICLSRYDTVFGLHYSDCVVPEGEASKSEDLALCDQSASLCVVEANVFLKPCAGEYIPGIFDGHHITKDMNETGRRSNTVIYFYTPSGIISHFAGVVNGIACYLLVVESGWALPASWSRSTTTPAKETARLARVRLVRPREFSTVTSFCFLFFSASPFCHVESCNLQDCLGKNTYHPEKCDKVLRQLYECCQEMYKAHPRSESSACPIPSVVDRWMKDHSK
ncbi:uncharacterized protein C8R40DRAFT_1067475 [Lentinula edodes]|uniref:uncharacterized protein n=1 Tax=Lentinula edodes TaxID=5353 RepID=UPI001E8E42AB|nr:uncharacterized protein C8R40DRAFT_1067475 [Lentinula edodes]KAH7877869.1 hypothetical protein C8R40DRAFT_1067475 [Lentinula edodes]